MTEKVFTILERMNKVNKYSLTTTKQVAEYLQVQKEVTKKETPEEMIEMLEQVIKTLQSLDDTAYEAVNGEELEQVHETTIRKIKECMRYMQTAKEDMDFEERLQQHVKTTMNITEEKHKMRYFIGNEANNHGILYKGNIVTSEGAFIVYEHGETFWKEEFLPFQLKEISKSKYYELASKK